MGNKEGEFIKYHNFILRQLDNGDITEAKATVEEWGEAFELLWSRVEKLETELRHFRSGVLPTEARWRKAE